MQSFFTRPVLTVAEELIGMNLVRRIGNNVVSAKITETEAYDGPEDKASHASKGMTERNKIMFGPGGHFYVYLCYGMHWMLNIVTGEEGYPAAVLIRGAGQWNGPGKLTKELQIDGTLNGKAVQEESELWITKSDEEIDRSRIAKTPRIGVDHAGEWAEKPYRFILE